MTEIFKRLVGILALALWAGIAAAPAQAQDSGAIRSTIGAQLDAFNQDDVDAAWQHASPTIRRLFGTPENFGAMVRQGYPMVWRNREAKFLELREIAGDWWQKLMIRDAEGARWILDYKMIETPQGWRIDAVTIIPAPEVGV